MFVNTVTWRWTIRIAYRKHVQFCRRASKASKFTALLKKAETIKGKLFEKKVYFSVEEQRNRLVEAMWFYYKYQFV